MARAPRCAQNDKLPVHYAAAKGASLEVVRLLLGPNREADAEVDKARRPVPPILPPLLPPQHLSYPRRPTRRALPFRTVTAPFPSLRYASPRTESCRCTTPLRVPHRWTW